MEMKMAQNKQTVCSDECADLCQVVLHPAVLSISHRAEEGQTQAQAPVQGPQRGSVVGCRRQGPHVQRGPCDAAADQRPAALVQQLGIGFGQSTVGPADGEENTVRVNSPLIHVQPWKRQRDHFNDEFLWFYD